MSVIRFMRDYYTLRLIDWLGDSNMRQSRRYRPIILLLFAIVAINCNPSAFGASNQFGGPYSIGGVAVTPAATKTSPTKAVLEKLAEFEAFRALNWNHSRVVVLTDKLLSDSLMANAHSNLPYADEFQRYNYVVQEVNGKSQILVATWALIGDENLGSICGRTQFNNIYVSAHIFDSQMVNFFPEDTSLPSDGFPSPRTRLFACKTDLAFLNKEIGGVEFTTLGADEISKPRGILDAHGKHYFLAQGVGKKPYPPLNNGTHPWATTTIDYAGEIIVDVKYCRYFVNQGSGTYRPSPGQTSVEYLLRIAQIFRDNLGTPPVLVWAPATAGQALRAWPVPVKQGDKPLNCGPPSR